MCMACARKTCAYDTFPLTSGILINESLFLQDTSDSVKLWEITRGAVLEDFGKVLVSPLGFFLAS
jgi:hypothetical protein